MTCKAKGEIMITKSSIIAKGVKFSYIETDKFKTNYFSFNFISELSKENSAYNSLIPLVLMRGCEKYPTQADINKRLQYLYSGEIVARNDAFGEYQIFGLKANMLDNRYSMDTDVTGETVDLLCEMLFSPLLENGAFNKAYTKGEKINLTDIIEAEKNNKTKYSMTRLKEEMCKDEVFGISKYGKAEDVEKITPQSLYNAYKKILTECPIEIYFVGKCDFEKLEAKLKLCFDSIERNPVIIKAAKTIEKASGSKEVVDIENVKQGKLCLGYRTGYKVEDNKYYLLQLFNEVFGGSPTSKLFMNVREKMSLCYYCRSIVNQRNGIMLVASGIEFKNKDIAQNAIIEQLNAIKMGNITEEELESARKSIRNGYLQVYDSAESMETWAFFRGICGSNATPKDECDRIDTATIDDIKAVAEKMTLDTVYFLKGKENTEVENG